MSWFINHTPDIDPCTVCFYFDSSLIIFCYSQWNSNHPPKWFVHVLIPRNCKCYLFWKKKFFTVVIKYIEMKRSFWFIQEGPKFNDKHPCKRHKGEIWYRHKRRRQSDNGTEIRVRQPQSREYLEPPEPGRGKE